MAAIERLIDLYCRLLKVTIAACLAAMVVLVFTNVVMRYLFNSGIPTSEELSRWLLVWLTFLGAIVALRQHAHLGVDTLVRALPPLGLELWHVGDPGNVGTLARACEAFGSYLALSPGCADPFGPKALRASTGSVFRVPLGDFSPDGAVALVARGAPPLAELDPSLSRFVLGSERDGLPEDVVSACAASATIPLAGPAESLNVAMAGTIALYDWRRSRG